MQYADQKISDNRLKNVWQSIVIHTSRYVNDLLTNSNDFVSNYKSNSRLFVQSSICFHDGSYKKRFGTFLILHGAIPSDRHFVYHIQYINYITQREKKNIYNTFIYLILICCVYFVYNIGVLFEVFAQFICVCVCALLLYNIIMCAGIFPYLFIVCVFLCASVCLVFVHFEKLDQNLYL